MASIHGKDLTILFRVTGPAWGRRAAAAALMLYEHGCPACIQIRRYRPAPGRKEAYSSGYEVLCGVPTPWVLCMDADSHVYGDVAQLIEGMISRRARVGIRCSPLQMHGRDGWQEDAYKELFVDAGLHYRSLATTCAFLLPTLDADKILWRVAWWRNWIDERTKLSQHYHHAQAAFALALAEADVNEEHTWWWGPKQLSFTGEPPGIIHHEALSHYRFPFRRIDDE